MKLLRSLPDPEYYDDAALEAEIRALNTEVDAERFNWLCDRTNCDGRPHPGWLHPHARASQRPPAGKWLIWDLMSGRGFGKLLSLDTRLPTPTGWTTMGQVQAGDQLLDEAGRPTTVHWASDVQWEDTWRVSFSDGSSLLAHGEHEWVTWTHAARKAFARSPHEEKGRFPTDWPAWQLRRLLGPGGLSREQVDAALALQTAGVNRREISRRLGLSRAALRLHLDARRYLPRVAISYPDSPGPRVRTTDEIRHTLTYGTRGDLNHCIPTTAPLDLPDADLPIDPYVLGCWLGDGDSCGGGITGAAADLAEIAAEFNLVGEETYLLNTAEGKAARFRAAGLTARVRTLGVQRNKHVPAAYLRGSVNQRLALLQGLMDTDGGVEAPGWVSFTNTRPELADAVYELAVSLGMAPRTDERPATLNGVEHGTAYRVSFAPTMPVFRLSRKASRIRHDTKQALRRRHRMIVSIERAPTVPMRCVTVDSPHSVYLAGRAMIPTHNTRTGAETTRMLGEARPLQIVVIAKKDTLCRQICFEGRSGLLNVIPPRLIAKNGYSKGTGSGSLALRLTNGTTFWGFSAETPDNLRGWPFDVAWLDEFAAWNAKTAQKVLDQVLLTLRESEDPRILITSTPQAVKHQIRLVERFQKAPGGLVRVTKGHTDENRANLSEVALEMIYGEFEGTRLGRQELGGELLEDVEGALWKKHDIDTHAVHVIGDDPLTGAGEVPDMKLIVVAVDPAISVSETSDETGIVAAGRGIDGHDYVLADRSAKIVGVDAAKRAWMLWLELQADRMVYEDNQGMEWVRQVFTDVWFALQAEDPDWPAGDPPIRSVSAKRGKRLRAEPVAARYEQGKVHHVRRITVEGLIVNDLAKLDEQMLEWVPDVSPDSPDRVDAAVYALTEIRGTEGKSGLIESAVDESQEEIKTAALVAQLATVVTDSQTLLKPAEPDPTPRIRRR